MTSVVGLLSREAIVSVSGTTLESDLPFVVEKKNQITIN